MDWYSHPRALAMRFEVVRLLSNYLQPLISTPSTITTWLPTGLQDVPLNLRLLPRKEVRLKPSQLYWWLWSCIQNISGKGWTLSSLLPLLTFCTSEFLMKLLPLCTRNTNKWLHKDMIQVSNLENRKSCVSSDVELLLVSVFFVLIVMWTAQYNAKRYAESHLAPGN